MSLLPVVKGTGPLVIDIILQYFALLGSIGTNIEGLLLEMHLEEISAIIEHFHNHVDPSSCPNIWPDTGADSSKFATNVFVGTSS